MEKGGERGSVKSDREEVGDDKTITWDVLTTAGMEGVSRRRGRGAY